MRRHASRPWPSANSPIHELEREYLPRPNPPNQGDYSFGGTLVDLVNLHDLTVYASGVTFWFSHGGGLRLVDSRNVRWVGSFPDAPFAIDYDPPVWNGTGPGQAAQPQYNAPPPRWADTRASTHILQPHPLSPSPSPLAAPVTGLCAGSTHARVRTHAQAHKRTDARTHARALRAATAQRYAVFTVYRLYPPTPPSSIGIRAGPGGLEREQPALVAVGGGGGLRPELPDAHHGRGRLPQSER